MLKRTVGSWLVILGVAVVCGAMMMSPVAAEPAAPVVEESSDARFFPLPIVPPGACALPNGDCVVTLDTICRLRGGKFQGPQTTCD